jgi:hypothetical protein
LKTIATAKAEVVGKEKEIVDAEAAKADTESKACAVIAADVAAAASKVQGELDAAVPLVE